MPPSLISLLVYIKFGGFPSSVDAAFARPSGRWGRDPISRSRKERISYILHGALRGQSWMKHMQHRPLSLLTPRQILSPIPENVAGAFVSLALCGTAGTRRKVAFTGTPQVFGDWIAL